MENKEKEELFMNYIKKSMSEMEEQQSIREKYMKDNPKILQQQEEYVRLDLRIPVSVAFKILEVLNNVNK